MQHKELDAIALKAVRVVEACHLKRVDASNTFERFLKAKPRFLRLIRIE